jgi:hypothetical protein
MVGEQYESIAGVEDPAIDGRQQSSYAPAALPAPVDIRMV